MISWYVVMTKIKEEQTAEIHLMRQGYITYLPQTLIHKGLRKSVYKTTEPLFPGYLFVQLSDGVDDWSPIKSTRGVSCVISFGGKPAAVPNQLIEALIQTEKDNGIHGLSVCDYIKGDAVRMLNQPFELVDAIVDTVKGDRILLVMEILGKAAKVEVGYRDIEPTNS